MNGHITDTSMINTLGSFHQGDEYQFGEYSRGRQCVSNSIAAIAYAQMNDIALWDSHDLDLILKEGGCLYQHIRPQQFFDQPISSGLLELDDIPLECDIFERHFSIIHSGNLYCDINKQAINSLLTQVSGNHNKSNAILVMGDQHGAYASGLIQCGENIFLFDAHSHSPITGMPCPDGKSILLFFNNTSRCADYIFQSATIRHVIQISLWKITINITGFYLGGNRFKEFSINSSVCVQNTIASITDNVNISKINENNKELPQSPVHSFQEVGDHTFTQRKEISSKQTTDITDYEEHLSLDRSDNNSSNICHMCLLNFSKSEELHSHELVCQGTNTNRKVLLNCKFCSKVIDHNKNLLSHERACERKIEHKQMSQQNKDVLLYCKFCSKVVDNKYNLSSHERACKRKIDHKQMSQQNKDVLLYCKFCSKVMNNKCNLSSHERACERKNKHKQMLEQNKHLLLYCKVCSKVMDNKPNLLKHEQLCGKKAEHKEMLQKKKTCTLEIHANMKRQLHLKNQYDQINSECDHISVKKKQVEQKIRDRQYEKSKLQSQLSNRIFHHDNNKLYSHLKKQINSLDEQISKFVLLVKQLSQDESELSNRKCGIEQEMKQMIIYQLIVKHDQH